MLISESVLVVRDKKSPKLAILGQPAPVVERKDAARNRVRILEAAKRLLKSRPIHEVCMDEIAVTAGVGKGTLYRRFEDRAALCRALLHEEAIRVQEQVLAGFGLPHDASNLVYLTHLVDALFDFAADNATLLSEALAYERSKGSKRYDHPAHAWQRDSIARYLERAARASEIPPLDNLVAAEMILAALDPDLIQWHLGRGMPKDVLKKTFQELWRATVMGSASCWRAY